MPRSKKKCQQFHTKKRSLERFGIMLTERDQKQICMKIQNGDSIVYRKQSNRVVVHDVEYCGRTIRVVYDKIRKSIATVLTKDMN